MKRAYKLLSILAAVVVLGGLAAWSLSRQPQLRFVDGDVQVIGCADDDASEKCVQLRCTQALKRRPEVGLDARVEFTHFRREANGDVWQLGLAHSAEGGHRMGDLGVGCRVSGPRVVDLLVDRNFRPGGG
jgi:hypothetical protein